MSEPACEYPQFSDVCPHVREAQAALRRAVPDGRWSWHIALHQAAHRSGFDVGQVIRLIQSRALEYEKLNTAYCFNPGFLESAQRQHTAAESYDVKAQRCARCVHDDPHQRFGHYLEVARQHGVNGFIDHVQDVFAGTKSLKTYVPGKIGRAHV